MLRRVVGLGLGSNLQLAHGERVTIVGEEHIVHHQIAVDMINIRTEEVEEDGVTVTAVLNEDNEIEYTVRKVDENTFEEFNLPAMNYEDTREIAGTVYRFMGTDDMVKYILWNRSGYNYLVSIINSCTVDEALRIAVSIE